MGIIKRELYNQNENATATVFEVLSHPARTKIIMMLLASASATLGEITQQIGLSQSSTSAQVKKLKEFGLLHGTQVETSVRYSLDLEAWEGMKWAIQQFLNEVSLR